MSEQLTTAESKEYSRCNKIIQKNSRSFIACGEALSIVLTQKLYRQEYDTWEAYCLKKHGFKRSQAHRLMEASGVAKTSPAGDKIVTERQARELRDIPPEKHVEVIETAVDADGKLTGPSIKKAAEKIAKAEVIERDHEGHMIPATAMATWDRRDEVKEFLQSISKIKSWAEKLQKSGDRFYAVKSFSAQEVYTDCGNLYRMIKDLIPWSICATCQGQAPKSCALCHGRGMISKHTWDTGIDPTTKKMMKQKADDDSTQRLSATGG